MAGVTFSKDAANRIAKVVRKVEAMPARSGGQNTPSPPPQQWFYAKITDVVGRIFSGDGTPDVIVPVDSGNTGQVPMYSWTRMRQAPTGRFITTDPVVNGIGSAQALNPDPQIYTGVGAIARLYFSGYSQDGTPLYAFTESGPRVYEPNLAPHDHRSNDPNYGGFAFAVYHPGTSLPQLPWAI